MQQQTQTNITLEKKKFITSGVIYFLILLAALVITYLTLLSQQIKYSAYNDSGLIYESSQQLNNGKDPYLLSGNIQKALKTRYEQQQQSTAVYTAQGIVDIVSRYNYGDLKSLPNLSPPFATMLVSVVSKFITKTQFVYTIFFLNIVAGLISLYILAQYFFQAQCWRSYLSLILTLFAFIGTVYGLGLGEIALVLNFILITSCFLYKNNKEMSAGAILAFAANIKLFFALFILMFLAQKRHKALTSFIVSGLVLAVLPLAFYGVKPYQSYLSTLAEVCWYPIPWNASYYGILTRIFGASAECNYQGLWQTSQLTQFAYYLVLIFYLMFIYYFCRRFKQDPVKAFALFIPCMLLLSPLAWNYYLPLLILSFVHYFKTIQKKAYFFYYLILFIIIILVMNLPITLRKSTYITSSWADLASSSYLFFSLFVFHCVQTYCYSIDKTVVATKTITHKLYCLLATLFSLIFIVTSGLGVMAAASLVIYLYQA